MIAGEVCISRPGAALKVVRIELTPAARKQLCIGKIAAENLRIATGGRPQYNWFVRKIWWRLFPPKE